MVAPLDDRVKLIPVFSIMLGLSTVPHQFPYSTINWTPVCPNEHNISKVIPQRMSTHYQNISLLALKITDLLLSIQGQAEDHAYIFFFFKFFFWVLETKKNCPKPEVFTRNATSKLNFFATCITYSFKPVEGLIRLFVYLFLLISLCVF